MSNLRRRNLAVLLACLGFMALVFVITLIRIGEGVETRLAQQPAAAPAAAQEAP